MAARGLSGEDARTVDGSHRKREGQDDVRARVADARGRKGLEMLHDSVYEVEK